jgi:hypothetical protein
MRHMGVCAVFALIAGCTGGAGAPTRSVSAPHPLRTHVSPAVVTPSAGPQVLSVPPDVPTTGPNLTAANERPPVMPVEATQHTPAGARAFAIFFIKTIDWGNATVSGAYIRHFSAITCRSCASLATGMDADRRAGRTYIGGRITVRSTSLTRHKTRDSVVVTLDSTGFEVVNRHRRYVTAEPPRHGLRILLELAWSASAWRVHEFMVES